MSGRFPRGSSRQDAVPAGRITARIHRTADGSIHREYIVDGVAYSSLAALEQQRKPRGADDRGDRDDLARV